MTLYLLLVVLVSLIGIRIYTKDFNIKYLSKKNSSAIKGIFILIVLISHLREYTSFSSSIDLISMSFIKKIGQLMVTLFLFYSGYGVYESIKKKKEEYLNSIPKKRFLITFIKFDICVILYVIINSIIIENFDIKRFFLSIIGWDSYGNSNWYIFDILVLYLITYANYKIFNYKQKPGLISLWLFTLVFYLILYNCKEYFWYNTLFCYPLGVTYSYYKDKIDKIVLKNNIIYFGILIILLVTNVLVHRHTDIAFFDCMMSCLFALLVVVITMKTRFHSKIIMWFGDNLFWVYILQRIPMIILTNFNYFAYSRHQGLLILLVVIFTVLLTYIMKYLMKKIDLEKRLSVN